MKQLETHEAVTPKINTLNKLPEITEMLDLYDKQLFHERKSIPH